MPTVLACIDYDSTVDNGDGTFGACLQSQWVQQPGLLPPVSASEGLIISGLMITCCAGAWSLKLVRRFIYPRA